MANLDFFLKENGRIEYNRDLTITQYSNKADTIRLLTKVTYDIVNMNVTLPNNISTTKKILIQQPIKEGEYWVYSYPVDLSMTDFEMGADKALIRVGFFLYPDIADQSIVTTTGVCYIPIIKNTENAKPDGSVTETDLGALQGEINSINEKLDNLQLGQIDTAKNYNQTSGTIKSKFDSVDGIIGNIQTDITVIEKTLGSLDFGEGSIDTSLTLINDKIEKLEDSDITLLQKISSNSSDISDINTTLDGMSDHTSRISTLESSVDTNTKNIKVNADAISEIKEDILPTLQAGVRYEVVSALPTTPENGVVYIIKEPTGEGYIEYLYINGAWEPLGSSTASIDLSGYYTKTEVDNTFSTKENLNTTLRNYYTTTVADEKFATKTSLNSYYKKTDADSVFALKTQIPTNISQLNNNVGYIKNESGAFNYNYLTNKPTIPTKTSQLENNSSFITRTDLTNTLQSYSTTNELSNVNRKVEANTSSISGINQNIDVIEENISSVSETANTALALATSKQFSKVFDTKADMIAYIKAKQSDPLSVGTEFIIKDHNVSDYWVSAIYSSPITYTTKFGEVFEDVYYGVEESESKIDLTAYATVDYLENVHTPEMVAYIDEQDAKKVDLSAKATAINDSSTDTQWTSAKLVKDYVSTVKEGIDKSIADNTNKITTLEINLGETNETIAAHKEEADAKNLELDGRLDTHDAQLATLTTRIETEEKTRANEDSLIRASITALNSELDSYKLEADAKYLEYSETISKAESLVDYEDASKNLKFSSDSAETEFTISNVELTGLITMLSMFGPNEYN